MFSVVPMAKKHIKSIAELEKACFSSPWSEAALAEELSNENAYFIVAVAESEVLGYGGLQFVLDEGYITNIAVFEKHRRFGVAQAIFAEFDRFARQKGLAFISLEVRPSNTPAVTLYTKLGFEKAGLRKRFYTLPDEDGLIMTKNYHPDKD